LLVEISFIKKNAEQRNEFQMYNDRGIMIIHKHVNVIRLSG